jgi:hypothetical protein
MMTLDQHLPEATANGGSGRALLASLWTRATDWARTCADYYAASATYEQLSRLSDAELSRRGLSRDSLARDIVAVCERGEHR